MFHSLQRFRIRNSIIEFWITKPTAHSPLLPRFLHKTPQKPHENQPPPLTVSYLINSCGLSPQSALSVAAKVNIENTEKPDAVLGAFRSYGFTDTQIARLVQKLPRLLSCNPDKIIRPKLEFLLGIGFSSVILTSLVSTVPNILTSSLEKRLKRNAYLLRSIIEDNQQLATAIRRSDWLLTTNLETKFLPNVQMLKSYGVPPDMIARFTACYPRILCQATGKLKKATESIKGMGFSPLSILFVQGVSALAGLKPSTWEKKVAVYKSLGCSDGDIMLAFRRQPFCMLLGEERIRRSINFYVKELKWELTSLMEQPVYLGMSLDKRVILRYSIFCFLKSKGLVSCDLEYRTILRLTEQKFLDKYVRKYAEEAPEVLQAYRNKVKSFKN